MIPFPASFSFLYFSFYNISSFFLLVALRRAPRCAFCLRFVCHDENKEPCKHLKQNNLRVRFVCRLLAFLFAFCLCSSVRPIFNSVNSLIIKTICQRRQDDYGLTEKGVVFQNFRVFPLRQSQIVANRILVFVAGNQHDLLERNPGHV